MFECSGSAGVTLQSVVRRRPNAFNLVHQMECMIRGGYSGENTLENLQATHIPQSMSTNLQVAIAILLVWLRFWLLDWKAMDSAAAFATAYQIGRSEAAAATNLLNAVTDSTRAELKELVRPDVMF